MSFTQELTCRWSTSTWTPTRLLPARSFAQKLLHRSCYTGVQLTSRWSNCIWTPAIIRLLQFLYFSLAAGTARRWLTKRYPLRRVRHPNVWQNAGPVLFVLGQPSAEIVRVGWANMRCGEMRNFFARSNRLRRSCVSNAQTCGGMWISFGQVGHPNMWQNANLVRPGAAPSHEMRGNCQKLVQNCGFESSDASVAWKSNGNNCGKTPVF